MPRFKIYTDDEFKGVVEGEIKDGQIIVNIPREMINECGIGRMKIVEESE